MTKATGRERRVNTERREFGRAIRMTKQQIEDARVRRANRRFAIACLAAGSLSFGVGMFVERLDMAMVAFLLAFVLLIGGVLVAGADSD